MGERATTKQTRDLSACLLSQDRRYLLGERGGRGERFSPQGALTARHHSDQLLNPRNAAFELLQTALSLGFNVFHV